MRSEEEVRGLRDELLKLTGYISDYGKRENRAAESMVFANDACDVLTWVLEEESTERFRSDAYLDLPQLRRLATEEFRGSSGSSGDIVPISCAEDGDALYRYTASRDPTLMTRTTSTSSRISYRIR